MDGRYIVGFDGSTPSRAALAWALARAAQDPAPIALAFVRPDAVPLDPADGPRADTFLADAVDRVRLAHPALAITSLLLTGEVSSALAAAAGADDLLIVGTHGNGFVRPRALDSRTLRIALVAVGSLVVVPDVDLRLRAGIVVGIDHHASAAALAMTAALEAQRSGGELFVIQSVPGGGGSGRAGLAITEAIAGARLVGPKVLISSRLASRTPAQALVESARDKALLVIGAPLSAGGTLPTDSVLHDVLLNITAPVLVVRTPHEAEVPLPAPAFGLRDARVEFLGQETTLR